MLFDQPVLDAFNGGPGGTVESVKFPSQATMLLPLAWLEPEGMWFRRAVPCLRRVPPRHRNRGFPIDAGTLAQAAGIPGIVAERLGSLQAQFSDGR